MAVRAKFKVVSKEPSGGPGAEGCETVKLEPVTSGSAENESFYKWTPGGSISLSTVNVAAAQQFVVGQEYYVDFTPAE
jgi:hypothetical protein